MARVKINSRINAIVAGSILQGAASASLWVPDEIYANVVSAQLANSYTVNTSDFDQAAVIVTHSTTISVNNNSETLVPWDTEATNADLRAFHDTATNNSRLTVPANYGGLYFGFARVSCAGSTTGRRMISVYLNGVTVVGQDMTPAVVTNTSVRSCPFWAVLSAGDYVEVKYFQDSGGAQVVTPGSFSLFRAVRI